MHTQLSERIFISKSLLAACLLVAVFPLQALQVYKNPLDDGTHIYLHNQGRIDNVVPYLLWVDLDADEGETNVYSW